MGEFGWPPGLKSGEPLSAREKVIHEQGLVAVLKTLHDELDRAVLEAYGWGDLGPLMAVVNGNRPLPNPPPQAGEGTKKSAPLQAGEGTKKSAPLQAGEGVVLKTREEAKRVLDEALLERLVALNAERAAEEKRGLVRWLRPEFQNPAGRAVVPTQVEIETGEETVVFPRAGERRPWPATLPEQVKAVAEVLTAARTPLADGAIAACFTGRGAWKKRLPQIIDTLVAVGRVRRRKDGFTVIA